MAELSVVGGVSGIDGLYGWYGQGGCVGGLWLNILSILVLIEMKIGINTKLWQIDPTHQVSQQKLNTVDTSYSDYPGYSLLPIQVPFLHRIFFFLSKNLTPMRDKALISSFSDHALILNNLAQFSHLA